MFLPKAESCYLPLFLQVVANGDGPDLQQRMLKAEETVQELTLLLVETQHERLVLGVCACMMLSGLQLVLGVCVLA